MSCAQCDGIETQFGQAAAKRSLRRFRRRGPDESTRLLIDALRLALDDIEGDGATLLDVGAGIGAIHHALLDGKRVMQAVHVDASTAHLAAAREETERRGHGGQVAFVHGDFVAIASELAAADIVTLDRVICCYPDMEGLVSQSAAKATRLYGAVYPRDVGWMRIGVATINMVQRLRRSPFRVFFHRPSAIDTSLRALGLHRRSVRRTLAWEAVVYERRHAPQR